MYKKGDLKLIVPKRDEDCNSGFCWECSQMHEVGDSRHDGEYTSGVCLPHSCSEWVIGDIDAIQAMIEDLQKALKNLGGDA